MEPSRKKCIQSLGRKNGKRKKIHCGQKRFGKIKGYVKQRWSRGHKALGQGQGHKKIRGQGQLFRGQTLSRPRTGMLEAKAKDEGHKRKCSPKKKRKGLRKNFSGDLQKKKKVFTKIFQAISTKKRFQKTFQALHKILTIQKIVLSSSRGQANFRGLEASRPSSRT